MKIQKLVPYVYLLVFMSQIIFKSGLVEAAQAEIIMEKHSGFTALPDKDHGRVLINAYFIPKPQGLALGFYLLGALSGAPQAGGHPFDVMVYDVTDNDPILLGRMIAQHGMSGGNPAGMDYKYGWIEYNAPVGKRTLMLTTKGLGKGSSLHTDFIELNIMPEQVTHVSLSQYGIMRFAYFGEIELSASNYKFCTGLASSDTQKIKDTIAQFIAEHGMSSSTRDFENYCRALAQQDAVLQPGEAMTQQFEIEKPDVVSIKSQHYVSWTKQAEKPLRYDLMKVYEDKKTEQNKEIIDAN